MEPQWRFPESYLDEAGMDYALFRCLTRKEVEEDMRCMPREYRKQCWRILCYYSRDAFEAEFPSPAARQKILQDVREMHVIIKQFKAATDAAFRHFIENGPVPPDEPTSA